MFHVLKFIQICLFVKENPTMLVDLLSYIVFKLAVVLFFYLAHIVREKIYLKCIVMYKRTKKNNKEPQNLNIEDDLTFSLPSLVFYGPLQPLFF